MPHLIVALSGQIQEVTLQLREAHDFLVARADTAVIQGLATASWGTQAKRVSVDLRGLNRPEVIGKDAERLSELFNMAATVERLLAALEWCLETQEFANLQVSECHPSTSDTQGANDLVLVTPARQVVLRAEVSDIVSGTLDGNKKERKDLRRLGCAEEVQDDGVSRFIVTSPEFAAFLTSPHRDWELMHYLYENIPAGDASNTRILRVQANEP